MLTDDAALCDALAAVTDDPRGHWIARMKDPSRRGRVVIDERDREARMSFVVDPVRAPLRTQSVQLAVTDVAEAMEILQTRELVPPTDEARGFWCTRCKGSGLVALGGEYHESDFCPECSVEDADATGGARRVGYTPLPSSLHALLSWAALGRTKITHAEEGAWHGARLLTLNPKVVVWRSCAIGPIHDSPDSMLWQIERMRVNAKEASVPAYCDELYAMGASWVCADDRRVVLAAHQAFDSPWSAR